MHPDHTFWPWHGFGMFPVLFFLLCIVVVFFLGKKTGSSSSKENTGDSDKGSKEQSPMDILKMRYAKGEIDQEEFERIKKTLQE